MKSEAPADRGAPVQVGACERFVHHHRPVRVSVVGILRSRPETSWTPSARK